MNKIYNPSQSEWEVVLKRPTKTVDDIEDTVNQIFAEVKAKGDAVVAKYTDMFDGIKLENTLATSEEIAAAEAEISEELKSAILLAKKNIESRRIWNPLHPQPVFAEFDFYGNTVAETIFENGLCLPSGTAMTSADLNFIKTEILAAIKHD